MIWRLTYCNKKGVEARIDIIKGDRTSVEIVQGSGNPFTLSYKLDKNDKSGHIMTSSADIEFFETEEFNIDKLKTSNETELKVEYFEDNVLTWSGFILPDFFSREIGSPNIVRMTASDRLTALKGVTLSDLPAKVSLRDLIELSLDQTGLSLALVSQVQINQGSTNILDSEILSQRLTDVRGRSISCYDILMSIMVGTNSTIRQRKGQWQVYNKLEHELRAPTIFFDKVERGAIRTIQPVASSVGVYNEFGGGRSYPDNYDFSDGLTGWTAVNGFNASIDDRRIINFSERGGLPPATIIINPLYGESTERNHLVNANYGIEHSSAGKPYLRSSNIPVVYPNLSEINVAVEINATSAPGPGLPRGQVNFAVIASNGVKTMHLNSGGTFSSFSGDPYIHKINFSGESAYAASTSSKTIKGLLQVEGENLADYNVNIRIYGQSQGVTGGVYITTSLIHSVEVKMTTLADDPKGNLYKTTQGSNYTKLHDVETVIFGDYIRKGLNGYFYDYPIDDTSNLYLPSGELSSPQWITAFDTTERPLLHHVSRQKSSLFSVAHDILKANINVESFDPLATFQDCKGGKYVVISARFDFLRSEVNVELEQIAYDNTISKRDYIYSYFGEGEDSIKSIGGIAGGGGGTGGLTPGQIEIIGGIKEKVDEVEERINNSRVGVANLLRNTGFLGDFQPLNVDNLTALENSSPIDTNPLKFWIHSDTSVIDAPSRSGKGVRIGSIQQDVVLKIGEPYVLSFWAKGTSLIVDLVDTIEIPLTSEYERYSFDIVAPETKEYTFNLIDNGNTAEVYEIMLSNGNAKVSYSYAEEDDVKAISQLQAINVITDAIKNYDTDILGGLILTSMIQLGKYKDGIMEKVTSGINGIYNNDDDPAIWAGGSFDDAIRTVQKFIDNPNFEPSATEWEEMANIVMTHGGDGFFRGYVYALGGLFRGRVESNSDGNRIVIDPEKRAIRALDEYDNVRFEILFADEEQAVSTVLRLNTYDENGVLSMRTRLRPLGLSIQTYTGSPMYSAEFSANGLSVMVYDETEIKMDFSAKYNSIGGHVDFKIEGLPTTGDGLPSNWVYNDNGFLKIKQ